MKRDDENPLTLEEDFYLPLREASSGSYAHVQEDIDYFLKNLYAALRIPKEYLGRDR